MESYPVIMTYLKNLMKEQKLHYGDLSKLLKVPESTLKKWFIAKDGPLTRLTLICTALGTTLEESLKKINKKNVHTIKMAKKQQEYFLKDRTCFEVYWLLAYERRSPLEIQQSLKITQAELQKHFLKLDRLDLIEYSLKEKARPPKTTPVRWNSEGPFMQEIFKSWSAGILKESIHSKEPTDLILQYFQITDESEAELRKDLLLLEEKYARRTIYEMSLKGNSLNTLRFVLGMAKGSFLTENA